MKLLFAAIFIALLSSCTYTPGSLDTNRQMLLICESWVGIFDRIKTRRSFDIATQAEIDAINKARPILNPICTVQPYDPGGYSLVDLEKLLVAIVAAEQKK